MRRARREGGRSRMRKVIVVWLLSLSGAAYISAVCARAVEGSRAASESLARAGAGRASGGEAALPVNTVVPAADAFSNVRSEIIERVRKGELPSVSVGVFKGGRVIWEESFGWADREARRAATPRTPYGLASLGKSITATAVMALVERGRV